jgi:magnesium transporter
VLSFHQYRDNQLLLTENMGECHVIRAVGPTTDEINQVHNLTGVPVDLLVAATDRDERPRVEIDDSCKLLIIRIPHHKGQAEDVPYVTIAFGVILTPQHITTVCSEESLAWSEILSGRLRIPESTERITFLCSLFMRIARQFLSYLNSIQSEANNVEKAIHVSMKNEMLIRMLNLEKCLVYFTTSLRANEPIWDRFSRIHGRELTEAEQEMIEDVRIEFRQAKDLADIHSNILSGMMDAFASVISNNLNVVIKVLTSVTIILMLPTLVASIYGMNVELPFQHSAHAFVITMIASFILSIAGVVVFWRRKWF